MEQATITKLFESFEGIAGTHAGGGSIWYARDLQKVLGYGKWDNFLGVVEKAKTACTNAGHPVDDHFADAGKMVDIGSGSQREVDDMALSRYACYLIAQNGDSRKQEIAFAQTYFAMQTRKQEVLEQRLLEQERLEARKKLTEAEKQLSGVLYEHGVDEKGFGYIRSMGDRALFGGLDTQTMKNKLGVKDNRPLADFLPTVLLKGKEFAAAITSFNVRKDSIHGVQAVTGEHITNNEAVRNTLLERGVVPEKLPPEEDIKKIERRHAKTDVLPNQQSKILNKTGE
jgi:DNA-damage-inducible protein D